MGLLLLRDDALDKMEEVLFAKNRGKVLGAGLGNIASMLPPVNPHLGIGGASAKKIWYSELITVINISF